MAKANKDGWLRHRGGKCPVEAGTLVDVRYRDATPGDKCYKTGLPAEKYDWYHANCETDIMAWRPHKPEQATTEQSSDVEMPAAKYFDGPLQWRDRIHTIDFDKAAAQKAHDAAMAALDSERAELVAKLKAEGLMLVQSEDGQQEDMSDPANWRKGDLLTFIRKSTSSFTEGKQYKLERFDSGSWNEVYIARDDEGDPNGWKVEYFTWHSRPTA